jgi:hypothetical protein
LEKKITKTEHYRIEVYTRDPHGDVYTTEVDTYCDVYHRPTGKLIFTTKSTLLQQYEGEGYVTGGDSVEITDDERYLLVGSARYRLDHDLPPKLVKE